MRNTLMKPEGSSWTDDQWRAIAGRNRSMLVAAAAGSGKTAVLVERIIRLISDPAHPLDVDRLLVATFTNAAAAEMRHRIGEALEQALADRPDSEHLRRQLALLSRASITTLHSFCLEVIERYYQKLGIDPGFRIANETEIALLRQDILSELFEEQYGADDGSAGFWQLADRFSGDKNDDGLFALVQRVYDFARSHPQPKQWLMETAQRFEAGIGPDNPWLSPLLTYAQLELEGMNAWLEEAVRIAEQPGGPEPYLANLEEDRLLITRLAGVCGESSWEKLHEAMQQAGFGKLKACKGDQYDKALQEQVKELRNKAKDKLNALREELFGRTLEQFESELTAMAPLMHKLTEIVVLFDERFQKTKRDKRLVDFADLEHYCLQVFSTVDDEGRLVPSEAALAYREHFAEVLLDEYQDTNRVQEAIVALISKEQPGNRFMVGDVKQSIYRFRLAEPALFQEKYKSFVSLSSDQEEADVQNEQESGIGPGAGTVDSPVENAGERIDLARNFRSRRQVTDGTNYIFRQLMNEKTGEIDYDAEAELKFGSSYYPEDGDSDGTRWAPELLLVNRTSESEDDEQASFSGGDEEAEDNGLDGEDDFTAELKELETAQLEARLLAAKIRELMGTDGGQPYKVYDKSSKSMRSITYRDIVILLRAVGQWAPVFIEELKQAGIPAHAELSSGYFEAVEVLTMLSLLKVIDNPYQDIPLAAVLRSPIVRCSAEELARLRIAGPSGAYYDALRRFVRQQEPKHSQLESKEQLDAGTGIEEEDPALGAKACENEPPADSDQALAAKLNLFMERLARWRTAARQGALADLIWEIYRETSYFDFVGGLPGGLQRQANLRALYDRARQYEATSMRGLFRFLRFIERMQESGGDLGTARALGEQEDVVRIMTIHKSKGLEFPVVFCAGLAKQFNRRELTDSFLLHKELGFGPKFLDETTRVSYPTLPWLSIRRKIQLESLAEEMRVLYVALTRAREKLFLVAAVKEAEKKLASWSRFIASGEMKLPDDAVASATCYLDWIGPALVRHPDAVPLLSESSDVRLLPDDSRWKVHVIGLEQFPVWSQAAVSAEALEEKLQAVLRGEPVDGTERWEHEVWRRLSWKYPHRAATRSWAKTSVTELKRLSEHDKLLQSLSDSPASDPHGSHLLEDGLQFPVIAADTRVDAARDRGGLEADSVQTAGQQTPAQQYRTAISRRPRFMEQRSMTAAERGSVFHAVMQRVPLEHAVHAGDVEALLQDMQARELLTAEQCGAVDPSVIAAFFQTELGRRMLASEKVYRELPFSFGLPANQLYGLQIPDAGTQDDIVMLQGVIDCLFAEGDGWILVDYKTDQRKGRSPARIAAGYQLQLDLYAKAVEAIWKRPVIGKYIYLFDGCHVEELS